MTIGFLAVAALAATAAVFGHPLTNYLPHDVLAALGALGSVPLAMGETKTIGEHIAAFEGSRQAKAAEMTALMEKATNEGRTFDAEEEEQYDTLKGEVEAVDKHLGRLRGQEKLIVMAAKPVAGFKSVEGTSSRETLPVRVKSTQKLEPGMGFSRWARCLVLAKGEVGMIERIASSLYPDDEVLNVIAKTAVAAGNTTDTAWAGPLVQYQQYAGDFIEFLRPQTIVGKFGANGIPALRKIPFNVMIKGQNAAGSASWVGEGAPKPVVKHGFFDVTLGITKLAAISVITDELARLSNPSAEALVRQSLADAVIAKMDTDFIDPDKAAVSGVSPASMTNGVTPISSSGTDEDHIRRDVQALFSAWIAANMSPTSAVLVLSPGAALALSLMVNPLGQPSFPGITMNGGTLLGIPVITSQYMADHQGSSGSIVMLVSASDVYLADDGVVTLDVSREASLQMNDSPDNPTTASTVFVSMFQTNQMAIRAERYVNWAKRRSGAVQWLDSVNWSS